MAEWRSFNASNEEDTCLWCGKKLRYKGKTPPGEGLTVLGHDKAGRNIYKTIPAEKSGDYEDGFFCGLRCAYQFGVRMAELGRRFNQRGGE
jgi:hypothetical protein